MTAPTTPTDLATGQVIAIGDGLPPIGDARYITGALIMVADRLDHLRATVADEEIAATVGDQIHYWMQEHQTLIANSITPLTVLPPGSHIEFAETPESPWTKGTDVTLFREYIGGRPEVMNDRGQWLRLDDTRRLVIGPPTA